MTISNEDVLIVPTNQVMQVEEASTTTNNDYDGPTAASLTFGVAVVEAIGEGEGGVEVLQPPPQEQQQCNDPNAGEHDDENAGVSTQDSIVHTGLARCLSAPQLKHTSRLHGFLLVSQHSCGGNPSSFFQTTAAAVLGDSKQMLDLRRIGQVLDKFSRIDVLIADVALHAHIF